MLEFTPALERPDLLAAPVKVALDTWSGVTPVDQIEVVEIDPEVADTAECCERYGFTMEQSGNCVVIAGKRGEVTRFAACVVLATTRADVNGLVRKKLDARKASFAPMDQAVAETGMEFGGITPFGLPDDWSLYVDSRVIEVPRAVFGSGVRRSKILAPGRVLLDLPGVEVIDGLAN